MLEGLTVRPHLRKAGHSLDGFTIIELLVAIVILGVLLALAVPSFIGVIRDSRRTSVVNEILISLQSARAESFKQSRDTYVCPSSDAGATCSTTASAWTNGWIVWVDNDRDGTFDPPPALELIRYQANDSVGVTVTTDAPSARFRYRPFQVAMTASSVAVCDPRGSSDATQHRSVIVADTGRPRIAKGDITGLCP